MRKFTLLFALILLLAAGCRTCPETTEPAEVVPDGVFVHISHGTDDLHRALMGLQMAVLMSADHDVLVYFDITGIEIVLNDAEDFTFSHFPGSHTQIQKLLENGAVLMACPGCLKVVDKLPQDLMKGVQVADKAEFFNFTKGRILTIDY